MQDGATENIRTYGLYNGKPRYSSRSSAARRQRNRSDRRVKAELPLLKSSIDPTIDLVVTFDRSITIRASLRQVEQTLMLAVAFVILVVYIFPQQLPRGIDSRLGPCGVVDRHLRRDVSVGLHASIISR